MLGLVTLIIMVVFVAIVACAAFDVCFDHPVRDLLVGLAIIVIVFFLGGYVFGTVELRAKGYVAILRLNEESDTMDDIPSDADYMALDINPVTDKADLEYAELERKGIKSLIFGIFARFLIKVQAKSRIKKEKE